MLLYVLLTSDSYRLCSSIRFQFVPFHVTIPHFERIGQINARLVLYLDTLSTSKSITLVALLPISYMPPASPRLRSLSRISLWRSVHGCRNSTANNVQIILRGGWPQGWRWRIVPLLMIVLLLGLVPGCWDSAASNPQISLRAIIIKRIPLLRLEHGCCDYPAGVTIYIVPWTSRVNCRRISGGGDPKFCIRIPGTDRFGDILVDPGDARS